MNAEVEAFTRLVREVIDLRAELDKANRACQTLGRIVDQNARMVAEISGIPVDEDGDGDYQAAWDRLYELKAERDRLARQMEAVEALADQWDDMLRTESAVMTTAQRNAWRWAVHELRAALATEGPAQ